MVKKQSCQGNVVNTEWALNTYTVGCQIQKYITPSDKYTLQFGSYLACDTQG